MSNENTLPPATAKLKESAAHVGESLKEFGGTVREVAHQGVDQLRHQAEAYYQQGRQKAQQAGGSVEQFVRDEPVKSVLIAAGVGLLLGILWKRS